MEAAACWTVQGTRWACYRCGLTKRLWAARFRIGFPAGQ